MGKKITRARVLKELKRLVTEASKVDPYSYRAEAYDNRLNKFCEQYNLTWEDVQRAHGWLK